MLDIRFIRENSAIVRQAAVDKNLDPTVVDTVIELDEKRRKLLTQIQEVRAERNSLTRDQIEKGRVLKLKLKEYEPILREIEEALQFALYEIPNVPAADVPIAPDESGNQVIKTWGEFKNFEFTPKSHGALAEELSMYDSKRGAKIAGSRAFFLTGELMMLERALLEYALRKMVQKGFTPMSVPWIVNKEALWGTGYFPWGKNDHYYTQDDQAMIGTAEVSLTAFHANESLFEKDLPIKICGISPCFRREIGSYGKDTQGFFRVHQFTKVEMVVLTVADEDATRVVHDEMREISESLLQDLQLPYQVLLMCSGDMGAGQRKKYDIETWFPSEKRYRETHSDSYFNDFQSRRLNIKYRAKDGNNYFVYTLNNTVAATPRLLAAVIENYQNADGSISIPDVLKPFVPFEKIQKRTE